MLFLLLVFFFTDISLHAQNWVTARNGQFLLGNQPYYCIGTNYWYGGLLALKTNPQQGKERLKKEFDFLQSKNQI